MKKLNNNTKLSTITLIVLLAMSAILVAIPAAIAQETRVDPWVYVNAIPNPQQVNRPVLIHVGSLWPTPTVDTGWEGLSVTVTKPDGTQDVIDNITTDSTGGTGVTFTPTLVGTYEIQSHFPEQMMPNYTPGFFRVMPPPGAIMEEGWSEIIELVVQEEPVDTFPEQPMPDHYWTRPIDSQHWSWATIAGNWLGHSRGTDPSPPSQTLYGHYNDYAPNTGHVLWAKPITMGGLAGGPMNNWAFEESDAYEPKFAFPVIIGGVIFYNQFETTGSETALEHNVIAVDLHTGEELWNRPLIDLNGHSRMIDLGQVFFWDSYNYHGVFPYLWTVVGSTWNAYDAYTGRWEYSMQGVPSGTRMYGPKGEIFIYTVNLQQGWMTLWNSSRVVSNRGSWRPHGNTYSCTWDAPRQGGYEWNVTIPTGLPGSVDKVREGIILGTDFDKYFVTEGPLHMWAISTEPGQEGTLLYNKTWSTPLDLAAYDVEDASVEDDVFVVSVAHSRAHYGFRLSTGEEIWGPTESQHYTDKWGYSSGNSWDSIYDGKYFSGNYGGELYCRDVQTGETLWVHTVTDYYNENLHNNKWRFRPAFFADGKIYIENTEHNPFNPQHRGAPFVAIDIDSGEEVFRIPYRSSEWSSTAIIGDSIVALFNTYDLRLYAIGKGPSETTVNAPLNAIPKGSSVVIRGTVMDVSPGTEDATLRLRFPNGVPAVADEYMSDWMLYVYNQFECPEDVDGVPVELRVVHPDGSVEWITTITSDSYGTYEHMYTPPTEGTYKIIATFPGSESYWPSTDVTSIGVTPAPAAPSYPDVPSADAIAQATVNRLPAYPQPPTAEAIAQETINRLPAYPEVPEMQEMPAYLTIDLVILALVAVAVVIGLIVYMTIKKQK